MYKWPNLQSGSPKHPGLGSKPDVTISWDTLLLMIDAVKMQKNGNYESNSFTTPTEQLVYFWANLKAMLF